MREFDALYEEWQEAAKKNKKRIVTYVWLDGNNPQEPRSKDRVVALNLGGEFQPPEWGYDGSSTEQAGGSFSDRILKPVKVIDNPLHRGEYVVLCEVLNPDRTPHATNTRHILKDVEKRYEQYRPWAGIEQEYTLYASDGDLLAPPVRESKKAEQGKFYCGNGADRVFGRELDEAFLRAGIAAGLALDGENAEVMPGQWEVQVGGPRVSPLEAADDLILARWLLIRMGERFGIVPSFKPKPREDLNGAGAHTNFSWAGTRNSRTGLAELERACDRLGKFHKTHIQVYGRENEQRLIGIHETSSIKNYTYGRGDRTASVRIPLHVVAAGRGYLEDRRPAANMDPYKVLTALLDTICGEGFDPARYGWKSDIPDSAFSAQG